MLVRAATILFFAEALEVWVVAAAPVRTRTTTNARTICFITRYPQSCIYVKKISLDKPDDVTIGYKLD
jgi:hypothetical protein